MIAAVALLATVSSCNKETPEQEKGTLVVVESTNLGHMISVQERGVLPSNTAEQNKKALQNAINEAAKTGANLYVTPCDGGYKCSAGILLKKGVSLVGAQTPGSSFVITDTDQPFITVESNTGIQGIQFYYSQQSWNKASELKEYKPTIQMDSDQDVSAVTLRQLSFYGEWEAMNFVPKGDAICELILVQDCHGYSLGGKFITIDKCNDTPRILQCSVDPTVYDGKTFSKEVIAKVISRKAYAVSISNSLNAVIEGLEVVGNYGGLYMGAASDGSLTNFTFKHVTVGACHEGSDSSVNAWEIAQGSVVANAGAAVADAHSFVVKGMGRTSITDVNATSRTSEIVETLSGSNDFILFDGEKALSVSVYSCKMSGYQAADPFNVKNSKAVIAARNCVDKDGNFFNL